MLRFKFLYRDGCAWQNLEFLRHTRSNPIVNKTLFHTKNITRVEQEYWYNNEYSQDEDYKIWIAYDDESDCQIGYVQYHVKNLVDRRCEFGYVISPEWNNKYDKKIVHWAVNNVMGWTDEVHRLETKVFTDDEVRINQLVRCGFEWDGVLRHFVRKDGIYKDVGILSVLLSS